MISLLCATLINPAPSTGAVFTGTSPAAGRNTSLDPPTGLLFRGIADGDSYEFSGEGPDLAKLLASINDFFHKVPSERHPQSVASLYGDTTAQETGASATETGTTIPVIVGGGAGNQDPIQIFTGADTSKILSQLFSGILNVDEASFLQRRDVQLPQTTPLVGGAGSAGGAGSSLGTDGFLATQPVGSQAPFQPSWSVSDSVSLESPVYEEKKTAKTSDLVKVVLMMLNPYFYGSLLLILLFSVAWSMRSRFARNDAPYL